MCPFRSPSFYSVFLFYFCFLTNPHGLRDLCLSVLFFFLACFLAYVLAFVLSFLFALVRVFPSLFACFLAEETQKLSSQKGSKQVRCQRLLACLLAFLLSCFISFLFACCVRRQRWKSSQSKTEERKVRCSALACLLLGRGGSGRRVRVSEDKELQKTQGKHMFQSPHLYCLLAFFRLSFLGALRVLQHILEQRCSSQL